MKDRVHRYLSLLVLSGVLLLSVKTLPSPLSGQSETWIGIIETAGLWGSMQLKLSRQGTQWKGESTLNVAGNELSNLLDDLQADGTEMSFSTELQVMGTRFTLHFRGKRNGNKLGGSVSVIRDDRTVTSGTWNLEFQEGNKSAPSTFELPAPTGRYSVGRTSFHWKDSSRQEVMTARRMTFAK